MKRKRLIAFVLCGMVLIFAALGYLYFWLNFPIGSGPAGPIVSKELFSKPWSDRQVLLVGLGDSVTAGFGANKGYSYFDRLIENPADEFSEMQGVNLKVVLPHLQFTNLAVSGSTSGEHLAQELKRIPSVGSNVLGLVVMTTGGNDIIHNYGRTPPREEAMYGATLEQAKPWITNFEERLELMISQVSSHFQGGCQIFLANIFDPTDGVGDAQRAGLPAWPDAMKILAAYNDMIVRSAKKHPFVHVIDIHDPFLGHGIHCTQFWRSHYDAKDPHYWYYSNLEDPNERGYDVIRRLFLISMATNSASLRR